MTSDKFHQNANCDDFKKNDSQKCSQTLYSVLVGS